MPRRTLSLLVLTSLVSLGAASAQDRSPQIGGFLQWTAFDQSLSVDDFFAVGGLISLPLRGNWGIEADVSRAVTNGPPTVEVSHLPVHARLTYAVPVRGRTTALLGAGYVHNWYGASRDASDGGMSGLLGMQVRLTDRIGARFDVLADYMPSPANVRPGVGHNLNLGLRQGLTLRLGKSDRAPAPLPPAPARNPDSDGDGIPDRVDRCADTPPQTITDTSGCPLDSDGDGVPNRVDRCPDTAAGTIVNATGCPLDSDGDGVTDQRDRCPKTPSGTAVDASGCSLDSDGDGVPDNIDRCPRTPPGTTVDAAGCLRLFEKDKKSLILEGVNFANGKADLTAESTAILDNVAASLVANDEVRVRVEGHTSSTGPRSLNVKLSHARAEAVKTYLVAKGVAADRLVAQGFGPDQPVASNATLAGQAKNRRVELVKLD